MKTSSLRGDPYYFVKERPYRLARLRSYIIREHRRGRAISDVLFDPYLVRWGSDSLLRAALEDPVTIRALSGDVIEAIVRSQP